jgi:DNA-directed RNA polymerase subunit omega
LLLREALLVNYLTTYNIKMARVTVEDCTKVISNRFELVILASRRAKDIVAGAEITIVRDNDKDPVVALREIAEATIAKEVLLESVIAAYQDHTEYAADIVERPDIAAAVAEDMKAIEVVKKSANVKVHDGEFAADNLEIND